MSDPIGSAGSSQVPGAGGVQANPGAVAASSVSSGYSADNSMSHAGGSVSRRSDGVLLDIPADSPLNSRNYLAQAVQNKLQALKAVVALNANLPDDQIDLSDTQNLLLSLRGVLNDIKVLSGVAAMDIRSVQFQQTKDMVRNSPAKIEEIRSNIESIKSQIKTKKDDEADDDEIHKLEAQLRSEEVRLSVRKAVTAAVGDLDRITREMPVVQVGGISKSSLKTGEEELDELKRELQMLDIRFGKEDVRAVLASKILAEYNRHLVKESDRYAPQVSAGGKGVANLSPALPGNNGKNETAVVPEVLPSSLPELLPPQLVNNLLRFFSTQNPRSLSAADNGSKPSEQAIVKAAEGLAVVLATKVDSSTPTEPEPAVKPEPASNSENTVSQSERPATSATTQTVSEENPVDQPILGDNLSLEGANNPQAFTLLLIKERMADVEEALSKNQDGAVVDSVGANQLAQLIEQEREIDVLVAEALKDSERAEEAIRRASKA